MTFASPSSPPHASRACGAARWLRHLPVIVLAGIAPHALAVPTCTVASGAQISFGAVVALASSGDQTANSGSSFWVNCTADVAGTPSLYSSTPRVLQSGASTLPFSLSLVAPGGSELSSAPPGSGLGIAKDGTNQTVTLYGRLLNVHFRALPAGVYTRVITLSVQY
jgi:spore coat protein U-like protein